MRYGHFNVPPHYSIDPAALSTIVVLPVIGTATTEAQPGHWLTIVNISLTNTLVVNNATGTSVATLNAGKSVMLIADAVAATSWVVQYNTNAYDTTLQTAYDLSGGAKPQIGLTPGGAALRIDDYAVNTGDIFTISNNTYSSKYLNVTNSGVAGTPFIGLLGGRYGGSSANSLAIGNITTTGAGIVSMCDSSVAYTGYTVPNSKYDIFTNGEFHYGGAVKEGTAKTSPNERTIYLTYNAVPVAGSTVNILANGVTILVASSTYSITIDLYGRDVTTASLVSVRHKLEALVATDAAIAPTIIGQMVQTMETAGFSTSPANITLGTSGTTLTLTLNAPNNIVGASMDFRGVLHYRVLTE